MYNATPFSRLVLKGIVLFPIEAIGDIGVLKRFNVPRSDR
jgi:hypothetical protein